MLPEDLPVDSKRPDNGYDRRRQHVLWYGGAVMAVLLAIVLLGVLS